jgi:tellurite resistance protein TerB
MATRPTRSSTATAGLTACHINNHDQDVMQALVTAGALVALADGRVETIERDELVNFIDRQGLVPTFSRPEIAKAFDDRVRQLEERDSADVIVATFRPLAGLSLASVMVRTAERVAAADRQIHPSELQALKLIRLLLTNLPAKKPTAVSLGRSSSSVDGGSPRQQIDRRLSDDWPIHTALLPAILTLSGIGITATTGSWFEGTFWKVAHVNANTGDVDDYVHGLARRGIANLPGSELRPAGGVPHDDSGWSER